MEKIQFFSEDTTFTPKGKTRIRSWLDKVIKHYDRKLSALNFIFTSDNYLHSINKTYLAHDSYTDIITFDNSTEQNVIEGDVFISVDRVKENAKKLNVGFEEELHRVIVHGVLHLLGFNDKSEKEKDEMRKTENHWLNLRP